MKNTNETVLRMVLHAVEVSTAAAIRAVRHCIVVVVQKVMHLFQDNDLKDECRQKIGGEVAVCKFGVQKGMQFKSVARQNI